MLRTHCNYSVFYSATLKLSHNTAEFVNNLLIKGLQTNIAYATLYACNVANTDITRINPANFI